MLIGFQKQDTAYWVETELRVSTEVTRRSQKHTPQLASGPCFYLPHGKPQMCLSVRGPIISNTGSALLVHQ